MTCCTAGPAKNTKNRFFKMSWLLDFSPWLYYDKAEGRAWCKSCETGQKNVKYANGVSFIDKDVSNFKKDAFRKHEASKQHNHSVQTQSVDHFKEPP